MSNTNWRKLILTSIVLMITGLLIFSNIELNKKLAKFKQGEPAKSNNNIAQLFAK